MDKLKLWKNINIYFQQQVDFNPDKLNLGLFVRIDKLVYIPKLFMGPGPDTVSTDLTPPPPPPKKKYMDCRKSETEITIFPNT